MKKLPRISVVINTFNRKGYVTALLKALSKQDYPRQLLLN